jgi:glycosyltransferase involved in cell wall biosynthesis
MKVVQINSGFRGSTGTIMLSIADLVRSCGGEAFTFSEVKPGVAPNGHRFFGTKFENLLHRVVSVFTGISGKGSKAGTKALLKEIDAIGPDIIHLHNLHGWYINVPMLFDYIKKNNIKTVWTLHDCWGFTAQCSHFTVEKCEKWKTGCYNCPRYRIYPYTFVDRTDKMWKLKKEWLAGVQNLTIVTPSQWLGDLTKQSFLGEYDVRVINNGINLDVFKPADSDFREKYGLQDKKIVLGVASSWGYHKGLDVFKELSQSLGEEYRVVLVGTNDAIDKTLSSNIISIHRTYNQTELAEIYTAADVFVNPTREETFGLVNIEAIACGTPVVTFDVGGTPETVNENTGIVVKCMNCEGIKDAICQITSKGIQLSDCEKQAEKFRAENKFQEYIDLYKDILSSYSSK